MTGVPDSFPADAQLYQGAREERFLAVALETLVQDVSPVGDQDAAGQLGGYSLGEEPPPAKVPEFVELYDGRLTLSNPPFLLADMHVKSRDGEYSIDVAFNSKLQLLIDPPVWVTVEGPFDEVLETLEQMLAEIYRTRGRRLEMLDEGVVDPEEFADPR